jgi:PAS domain S-box-containing protein
MHPPVKTNSYRYLFSAALWLALQASLLTLCFAEQLPIKTYTTADGLARDGLTHIFQDSHGFMWFSTPEGVSRFDGYEFTNYGVDQGLPHRLVYAVLETRSGVYWIATAGGLCRFNPTGVARKNQGNQPPSEGLDPSSVDSMFVVYHVGKTPQTDSVTALFEDNTGNVWIGTEGGLYRIEQQGNEWTIRSVDLKFDPQDNTSLHLNALAEDGVGGLWIASENGLYHRSADGNVQKFTTLHGLPDNRIRNLLRDRSGRLWAGTSLGLCQIALASDTNSSIVKRLLTTKQGWPANYVSCLYQSSDGTILVGLEAVGLFRFDPDAPSDSSRFIAYTTENGLKGIVKTILEDRSGNLWLGTESSGVMKVAYNGLTTYREPDGLTPSRIGSIFESRQGALYVINGAPVTQIHRFDGRRFSSLTFPLPAGVVHSWGWYQVAFQDHLGDWWIPTNRGVHRFSGNDAQPGSLRVKPIEPMESELATRVIFRLYEDRRHDVWISVLGNPLEALLRWERSTGKFHHYPLTLGLPESAATAFSEDNSGNLWIGFYGGGLVRYRDQRFERFTVADGLPPNMVRGLHSDRKGRLWIATNGSGVGRIDDTNGARPRITTYTTADGLASDYISCVTEDPLGRIYLGTARGLDQLEPESGRIKHYTQKDGLGNNYVNVAFRDQSGALWFGTLDGLSRLSPEKERSPTPPNVKLRRLNIAGEPYRLSEFGNDQVAGLELSARQNQLQIDFASISFEPGAIIQYQYMLEGADKDWSKPTEQRSLTYANLQPGTYRFLVRAIGTDGVVSNQPAAIAFRIVPPFWRRWWFLALAAILTSAVIYGLSRRRLERLKVLRESENRFRTLAETASDAIITIDEKSIIVYVNAAAENVFGYPTAELIGADLTMLMPEYLRHVHQAGLSRYVGTGQKHISWEAVELPGLHKSGREIPLELSFGEFTRDDQRYFTGIARDITERKRSEEALRRTREERLVELERVRKRIARDLHDDIGSSLTQISLLSEVVRQRVDHDDSRMTEPLSAIATSSRELVDSMSDIVWAINPQKDHMSDLVQRMRGLASDVSTNCNMKLRFNAFDAEDNVRLGANLRREVFLVFKESLNNIVKHSGASEVDIEFRVAPNSLHLSVKDNGRGFDPLAESDGHGLVSMHERIRDMGGTLEMTSSAGSGTTIQMQVPMTE